MGAISLRALYHSGRHITPGANNPPGLRIFAYNFLRINLLRINFLRINFLRSNLLRINFLRLSFLRIKL